jgi:hypothetical protein
MLILLLQKLSRKIHAVNVNAFLILHVQTYAAFKKILVRSRKCHNTWKFKPKSSTKIVAIIMLMGIPIGDILKSPHFFQTV